MLSQISTDTWEWDSSQEDKGSVDSLASAMSYFTTSWWPSSKKKRLSIFSETSTTTQGLCTFTSSEQVLESIKSILFVSLNSIKYNEKNKLEVLAALTIRGITHDISFPIQLESKENIMIATGSIDINRTLFNIKYKSGKYFSDLGDRMIYDDFTILFKLKTITNNK